MGSSRLSTGEDLLKFDQANLAGVSAQLNPPQFAVKALTLRDLSAQVILETNDTLNLLRVARLCFWPIPPMPAPPPTAAAFICTSNDARNVSG